MGGNKRRNDGRRQKGKNMCNDGRQHEQQVNNGTEHRNLKIIGGDKEKMWEIVRCSTIP